MAINLDDVQSSEYIGVEPINETRHAVNALGACYIVEEGSNPNGWRWRKWSNGTAEAWGFKALGNVTLSDIYGKFARGGAIASMALPFKFKSKPLFFPSVTTTGGTISVEVSQGTSEYTPRIYPSTASGAGVAKTINGVTVGWYVRGEWDMVSAAAYEGTDAGAGTEGSASTDGN